MGRPKTAMVSASMLSPACLIQSEGKDKNVAVKNDELSHTPSGEITLPFIQTEAHEGTDTRSSGPLTFIDNFRKISVETQLIC